MNVLLENWDTPFGLPPFARIRDEDFGPAFEEALEAATADIAGWVLVSGNGDPDAQR
mgnify:CR=1 FL=1